MSYVIKPADKGFTLIFNGLEIGDSKLHCDAVFLGKQLDKMLDAANEAILKKEQAIIQGQINRRLDELTL